MRKILILLFLAFILSGCAAYKFQKSGHSGSQGYLASYNDEPILEYTVGKARSLPDLSLAQERFKRRRSKVEYYYKKMGLIEGRLKEAFWDPPAMIMDFMGGILRWPFIAAADYRYNRNPKYKERVDKIDEEKEAMEKGRINKLKEKLDAYIAEDLVRELSAQDVVVAAPPAPKPQPEVLLPARQPAQQAPVLPAAQKTAPQVAVAAPTTVALPPAAVIIAKPIKGYSPLKVNFSGQRSYSKSGKIVSYLWDFGDGDTSSKKNSENTYWSTTYGTRNFTVTLTVKDEAGYTSSATSIIEVSTP